MQLLMLDLKQDQLEILQTFLNSDSPTSMSPFFGRKLAEIAILVDKEVECVKHDSERRTIPKDDGIYKDVAQNPQKK